MPGERVIAVDLGASSGRVIGVRLSDGVVGIDSMHRFPNGPVRREVKGRARWCWDIDAIMEGVIEGIALVASKGPVHSIAVDSWAVDYGLIDEDGELVAPVTAYRDDRHLAAFQRLRTEIGDQEIYRRTGIQFLPFNTLYQLATDALDPGRPLDRAAVVLMIPDLVANRLCGSVSGERTNAGSSVLRIGTPSTFTMRIPCTPLCELMRFRVSSTSDCAHGHRHHTHSFSGSI